MLADLIGRILTDTVSLAILFLVLLLSALITRSK